MVSAILFVTLGFITRGCTEQVQNSVHYIKPNSSVHLKPTNCATLPEVREAELQLLTSLISGDVVGGGAPLKLEDNNRPSCYTPVI